MRLTSYNHDKDSLKNGSLLLALGNYRTAWKAFDAFRVGNMLSTVPLARSIRFIIDRDGTLGMTSDPRDPWGFQKGIIGTLGIPRDSKKALGLASAQWRG